MLDDALDLDSYVSGVPLAVGPALEGTDCVVAGWGVTDAGDDRASEELMYLDEPVLGDDYCSSHYVLSFDEDKMLCAGFEEGIKRRKIYCGRKTVVASCCFYVSMVLAV